MVVMFSICMFCCVIIFCKQDVRIGNLEKEIDKQKKVNQVLQSNLQDSEEKCQRIVDSYFSFMNNGGWETYKE